MKGNLKSKAPRRGMDREPSGKQVTNNHYNTPAVIGGSGAGAVKGWECIQPNTHNKPGYLISAQAAMQLAWVDYLGLIDTLERSGRWDQESVEDAWDRYDQAKRDCEIAYNAYCQGYDFIPCEF